MPRRQPAAAQELSRYGTAGEHLTRRQFPLVTAGGFQVTETERLKAGTVERIHAVKPARADGTGTRTAGRPRQDRHAFASTPCPPAGCAR
jgi:hypothetical protein